MKLILCVLLITLLSALVSPSTFKGQSIHNYPNAISIFTFTSNGKTFPQATDFTLLARVHDTCYALADTIDDGVVYALPCNILVIMDIEDASDLPFDDSFDSEGRKIITITTEDYPLLAAKPHLCFKTDKSLENLGYLKVNMTPEVTPTFLVLEAMTINISGKDTLTLHKYPPLLKAIQVAIESNSCQSFSEKTIERKWITGTLSTLGYIPSQLIFESTRATELAVKKRVTINLSSKDRKRPFLMPLLLISALFPFGSIKNDDQSLLIASKKGELFWSFPVLYRPRGPKVRGIHLIPEHSWLEVCKARLYDQQELKEAHWGYVPVCYFEEKPKSMFISESEIKSFGIELITNLSTACIPPYAPAPKPISYDTEQDKVTVYGLAKDKTFQVAIRNKKSNETIYAKKNLSDQVLSRITVPLAPSPTLKLLYEAIKLRYFDVKDLKRLKFSEELGKGTYGTVYNAVLLGDNGITRHFAAKVIEPSNYRAAIREIQALYKLNETIDYHSFYPIYYGAFMYKNDNVVIAMELIKGSTLNSIIEDSKVPKEERLELANQLLKALTVMIVQHGIYHRDLKPSNILVTKERTIKVLDYSSCCTKKEGLISEHRDCYLGCTYTHAAPEILDPSVDYFRFTKDDKGTTRPPYKVPMCHSKHELWSWAVIALELITGTRAYKHCLKKNGDSLKQCIMRHPIYLFYDLDDSDPSKALDILTKELKDKSPKEVKELSDLDNALKNYKIPVDSPELKPLLTKILTRRFWERPNIDGLVQLFESKAGDKDDELELGESSDEELETT